jgi:hypothetical protein
MRLFPLLILAIFFAAPATAQLPDSVLQLLKNERARMYEASLGDYKTFGELTGDDYLTANADGSYGDKAQTLDRIKNNPLPRLDTMIFKEDRRRVYGNVVFNNGRIQGYKSGIVLVDFLFTEAWIYRDNRWQFINWHGTYTGISQHYEFIEAVLIAVVLLLLFFLVRFFMRRRKAA